MSRRILISETLAEAALHHEVTVEALLGTRKFRDICLARWRAMTRFRSLQRPDGSTRFSLPQIAGFVGLKDHASVIHGLRRYKEYLDDVGVDNTVAADEWVVDASTGAGSYPQPISTVRTREVLVRVE